MSSDGHENNRKQSGWNTRFFYLVFLLILLCLSCTPSADPVQADSDQERLQVGADRLFEEPYVSWIREKRVGLITNHTGVNHDLEHLTGLFEKHPASRLALLFAPEHGIGGAAQAGDFVESSADIVSLFGNERRPTSARLSEIDVLVFDIQDVGARFYTYMSTMLECMKSVAGTEVPFIVLDRPNPIDGTRVEGPLLEKRLESFVGIADLPVRHGMTPGELALLLQSELQLELDLRVVPLAGWHRSQLFDETGLQWIAPSPNMPTPATATVYPGLCLIEGTNLSEGRGTTLPFQLVGSPWLDSSRVCLELNRIGLNGVRFRPQDFTPTFSKFKGLPCRGIQIHVLDESQFQPIPVALHLLQSIHVLHPDQLTFDDSFFDRLAGNGWIRTKLQEGTDVQVLVEQWQPELNDFKRIRDKYLLY